MKVKGFLMEKTSNKRPIREMLGYLEKRPGMYLGKKGIRLDYLSHLLDGWLLGNVEPIINYKYHMEVSKTDRYNTHVWYFFGN